MANSPVAHLTRRYEFSASHRLHSNAMPEEENQRIYGKCNNPYGHGHNYHLEVTVAGPIDPTTGMVMNIVDLDAIVRTEVLVHFDHTNLNLDLACFRDTVPTSENLLLEIAGRLRHTIPGLVKLKLQETGKNFFEYRIPMSDNK